MVLYADYDFLMLAIWGYTSLFSIPKWWVAGNHAILKIDTGDFFLPWSGVV
jgi:hypothetical protein